MTLLSFIASPEEYMLPCLSKKFFDFDCFGCGLQRSVVLLVQGEFAAAFQMYPAIYTLIPLFIVYLLSIFFKFKHATKLISGLAIVSIVIIIINFIIKLIN
jgi:hypothetical protein